jgi:hypothetical protein
MTGYVRAAKLSASNSWSPSFYDAGSRNPEKR